MLHEVRGKKIYWNKWRERSSKSRYRNYKDEPNKNFTNKEYNWKLYLMNSIAEWRGQKGVSELENKLIEMILSEQEGQK